MKLRLVMLFLTAGLVLSGCDKMQQTSGNASQQSSSEETSNIALSKYIKAYNQFVPDDGIHPDDFNDASLQGAMVQYEKRSGKFSDDDLPPLNIVTFNYFEIGVDALDEGVKSMQALKQEPVDKAAAALLFKARALQSKAIELKAYFDSKKYLDDNFAKAKAENADFLMLWKETVALNEALGVEVSAANDARELVLVKHFKDEGQLLAYGNAMAMIESKKLVHMLEKAEFNEALIKNADTQVLTVEKTLAAYQAEQKQAQKAGKLDNDFDSKLLEQLNTMLGEYRSAKNASKVEDREKALQQMIKAYNEAVFYRNQMN
jgi:hypothetical protein